MNTFTTDIDRRPPILTRDLRRDAAAQRLSGAASLVTSVIYASLARGMNGSAPQLVNNTTHSLSLHQSTSSTPPQPSTPIPNMVSAAESVASVPLSNIAALQELLLAKVCLSSPHWPVSFPAVPRY